MIFATTVFYTPLMPLLPVFSLFGIVANYWWQKYMLFRKCKIPQHMGEKMSMNVSQNIPFVMLLYAIGQFIFINALSEGRNQACLPIVIVCVCYFLIPKDFIMHKCETTISRDDSETYSNNRIKFLIDYDRSNPLTAKEATLNHLDKMETQEKDETKLQKIRDMRAKMQMSSVFGSLEDYGKKRSLEQRVNRIFGNDMDTKAAQARANILSTFFNKASLLRSENELERQESKKDTVIGLFRPNLTANAHKIFPDKQNS
jgi:hypothetical protein